MSISKLILILEINNNKAFDEDLQSISNNSIQMLIDPIGEH